MPKYKIAYGSSRISGGLFLRQEAPKNTNYKYTDGEGKYFKHLSTFAGKSTIKENLIELLENAKRYVFFTSFLIQDEQIIESLIKAVRRPKGHVYVLTTLKSQDFDIIASQGNGDQDDEWNFKEHTKCIQELVRNGISVKARKDCHAKFAIIDDRYATITSANSVPTCFSNIQQKSGRVREANPENGVMIEIPSEVNRIANMFRSIWRSSYNYYISPDSRVFEIGEVSNKILSIESNEPDFSSDEGRVIWTAPNDCRIRETLAEMIDTAKETITISSWVIKGIEKHVLGEKLLQSAKRGVEIEILVRGMYRRDHLESCHFLKQAVGKEITIRGDFCNHSKAALIDNKWAMLMSANIDSQHGLDSSVEVGFESKQSGFVDSVANFLNRLRAGCVLEYVANPTQSDASRRFATLSKPILVGDITIDIEQAWMRRGQIIEKLISEMKSQLIRVSSDGGKSDPKVSLLTDNIKVDCINRGNNVLKVLNIRKSTATENMRFQQILPETIIEVNVK